MLQLPENGVRKSFVKSTIANKINKLEALASDAILHPFGSRFAIRHIAEYEF